MEKERFCRIRIYNRNNKRIWTETDDAADTRQRGRARQSNSREAGNSAASSDNQPICNMIPSRSKKKTDFRNPSTLGP